MSIKAMRQAIEALIQTDTHPISSAEQYFKEMSAVEALQDAIEDAIEQAEKNKFAPDWDTNEVLIERIRELETQACRKCAAHELLIKSLEGQLAYHRDNSRKYQEAIATLESERQANTILSTEREWVSLTDEDSATVFGEFGMALTHVRKEIAENIEAKLKEKNAVNSQPS
jgi:hypothetical protein